MKSFILVIFVAFAAVVPSARKVDRDVYDSKSCDDKCKIRLLKEDIAALKKESERLRNRRWIKAYRELQNEHGLLQKEAQTLRYRSMALEQRNASLEEKTHRMSVELRALGRRMERLMKDARDGRTAALIYKALYEKCIGKCPAAK